MTPGLLFEYAFSASAGIIMIGMALWVVVLGMRNILRKGEDDEP